ncbi:TPA: hypothetical protein N3A08_002853 [Salmonella enterica subsp. salamae serovar 9,46:z4,z24:z39:z42]|uniref:DUF2635 domain-containing protein n=2 Tax=Salmonella enterica TaxID=28901 RepID=A0A5W5WCY1_SALNE|nr:hypothetical protein [Salmonella enterica]EBX3155540.1 hypothetical protein [Salmonella enterica subsp. enterica serovar Newport]ECD9432823.1 hypothetical protein [Salmonella enterica subsp. salamae]ECQ6336918.1 hypothetical protein [Salmonella enterica subsp. enterica serovar Abony]HCM1953786.1 hypothetical protein [Salmonella enterica subsp. salamae serovar 9,46:z4,z24:z39:z42]
MINVIARKGLRVPLEEHARRYITDSEPVAVSGRSAYYQRRLREGDLLLAGGKASGSVKTPPAPTGENKA